MFHDIVTIVAKYFVVIPVALWLFVLLRLGKRQRLRYIIFSAIGVLATAVFIKVAAALHQDPRPFVRDHVHPYFTHANDNGFPSDHTAFSAIIALVVLRYRLWMGLSLLGVAVIIGVSRVVAGVHHGQDIVGGLVCAALGAGTAWLAVLTVRAIERRRK